MTRLQQELGVVPNRIQVDNSSEFISKALDRWAYVAEAPRSGGPHPL